ncbi:ATP-dependent DNA ligase domain-containing protein [Toxoplasma gondii GAB2-2007-GAL-DOM2]|uniref:ATP-dependent DNA ligase domain-containing protein n=2 Tax=Toxoplasma gondii TaxID=5811 RepID=A0A086JI90_TOXGO|nr:ATP-dependent DNA ligase domain-containing protein [Toxoplasma gondii GAB2-2007-GAL-DOM2]KFH03216.1 ATP-dependent DNA ligase domain-containing protein [Toxoplasma gondii VAND]
MYACFTCFLFVSSVPHRFFARYLHRFSHLPISSLYPLLRLLLPQLDRRRPPAQLKQPLLARIYAQVFALPPAAAARLKLYKDPAAATASAGGRPLAARAGDFASCVAASVQERAGRRQPSVTVVRGIFFDLGLLCLLVNSLKAYLIQVVSDPPGKIGKVKSRARGEFRVTFPHIQ